MRILLSGSALALVLAGTAAFSQTAAVPVPAAPDAVVIEEVDDPAAEATTAAPAEAPAADQAGTEAAGAAPEPEQETAPVTPEENPAAAEAAGAVEPAVAEAENPPSDQSTAPPAGECDQGEAEAATAMGATGATESTGWSGGTGGSYTGTTPQGKTRESKTWHAATARGLDLKGAPEPVAEPAPAPVPSTPNDC